MLEHGGRLRAAAAHYRIPLADWLDLSTGINPHPYPLPAVPPAVWQRLPEDDDGLETAAAAYYRSPALLPVAGSQAALQMLPSLLAGQRIALLTPSYAEHAHAWRHHQRSFINPTPESIEEAVAHHDIVLLVHPNNPDGSRFAPAHLQAWHAQLAARGGWLIIDEAFIDTAPEASLTPHAGTAGLIVLRSLGKFFGLAGARVGFVFAPAALRSALARRLGPWAVSGPARWAARLALADTTWQHAARHSLHGAGQRLQALLAGHGLAAGSGCALFQYHAHPAAAALHDGLARRGVLVRLFHPQASSLLPQPPTPPALRFGLPATAAAWARLDDALGSALKELS